MSVESFFLSNAMNKGSLEKFTESIDRNTEALNRFTESQPRYEPIIKSNGATHTSTHADGFIIDKSFRVPAGFRLVVEDFNINFTTAAGTIRIAILDAHDNEVIDILRDITASTNGTGRTVLDQGERLGVLGQASGAGIFGIYISGFLQKMIF